MQYVIVKKYFLETFIIRRINIQLIYIYDTFEFIIDPTTAVRTEGSAISTNKQEASTSDESETG